MKGLHEGEKLLWLANRSRFTKEEIAEKLNISAAHLSRIFKSQILTSKIKTAACGLFNVDLSFFQENGDFVGVLEPDIEYSQAMTEDSFIRLLEEKDRRHHEERLSLLRIIENLTKK